MVMKKKPNVVLSQPIPGRHKRRDIIQHEEMFLVVYDGQPMSISIIDLDPSHWVTPRYVNILFSQRASAFNAANKLNAEFKTNRFSVKTIQYPG